MHTEKSIIIYTKQGYPVPRTANEASLINCVTTIPSVHGLDKCKGVFSLRINVGIVVCNSKNVSGNQLVGLVLLTEVARN